MELIEALWHLLNFFAPALGVAVLASGLAKLFWRSGLRGTPWWRLFGWSSAAAAIVLVLGLWLGGRDGRMTTYASMVAAVAVALWGAGLGKRGA